MLSAMPTTTAAVGRRQRQRKKRNKVMDRAR
jgi:hypothetical protein